ncbi:MAG: hypothetical protein H6842_09325 [Rhodospirillaceae bacterium]|nr:hypothetical protein [Rhodospirillaceae bacterium]
MEMETATLARNLVPDDIRVRTTKDAIVLSDGQWSTEVDAHRFADVPQAERSQALRQEIDRAVASLRAARHGDAR